MANIDIRKRWNAYSEGTRTRRRSATADPDTDDFKQSLYTGQSWKYVGQNSKLRVIDGSPGTWRDPNHFGASDAFFHGASNRLVTCTTRSDLRPNGKVPNWYLDLYVKSPEYSIRKTRPDDPDFESFISYSGNVPIVRPGKWSTAFSQVSPDEIRLRTSAILAMKKKRREQPIHMGMFLAGVPESAKMVYQTVKALNRSINLLKRGRLSESINVLANASRRVKPSHIKDKLRSVKPISIHDTANTKVLSEKWLECQFGWGNLYQDIQGIFKTLAMPSAIEQMPRVTTREVRHDNKTSEVFYDDVLKDRTYGTFFRQQFLAETYTTLVARCDYAVGDPDAYRRYVLGITGWDLATVAWDKVPFSFVIDWFLPINGWIESMIPASGLTYLGGSYTMHVEYHAAIIQEPMELDASGYHFIPEVKTPAAMELQWKTVDRTVWASEPGVSLFALFTQFRLPDSLWHLATSLALFRTNFSRIFRK